MRMYLVLLLILSQTFCPSLSLAATSLQTKGQSGSTWSEALRVQAPNSQVTTVGDKSALVETGNGNMLVNPSFEASTVTTGWTAAGTKVAETTNYRTEAGKKAIKITVGASTGGMLEQALSLSGNVTGNYEASQWIKTTASATLLQFCIVDIDSSQRRVCQDILRDGNWHQYIFPSYPGFSTIGIAIYGTAVGGDIYADDSYLGPARNIGSIQQSTFFGGMTQAGASGCVYGENTSSSLTNFVDLGTGTGCNSWSFAAGGNIAPVGTNDHRFTATYMPIGTYQIFVSGGIYNSASGQSCVFRLSDGTNVYQGQQVYPGSATGSAVITSGLVFHVSYATPQSAVTFKMQASDDGAAGCSFNNNNSAFTAAWNVYFFPSGSQTAVRMDNSNYDWRAYTPTFTNWGTVTNIQCQEKRDGPDNLIRCKFTAGTVIGSQASVSLPGSNVTADTTKVPSAVKCGDANGAIVSTTNFRQTTICTPSSTTLTFGSKTSGTDGFGGETSSNLTTTGGGFQFDARVPIQGWSDNQNAPLLIGGVTTNSAGTSASRHEYGSFGGSTVSNSNCTASSTCTIWTGTALSSVTATVSPVYNATFTKAFSSVPDCTCSCVSYGVAGRGCFYDKSASTTSLAQFQCPSYTTGGASVGSVTWSCDGAL